jgi:hypothetical protein
MTIAASPSISTSASSFAAGGDGGEGGEGGEPDAGLGGGGAVQQQNIANKATSVRISALISRTVENFQHGHVVWLSCNATQSKLPFVFGHFTWSSNSKEKFAPYILGIRTC